MQEKAIKENPYPLMIEGQGELNRRSLFFVLGTYPGFFMFIFRRWMTHGEPD